MHCVLLFAALVAEAFEHSSGGQPTVCSQGTLSVVSAGDYGTTSAGVAPSSLVSIFGMNLAAGVYTTSDQSPGKLPISLGGVSATITDASGDTLPISLLAVTSGQVNAVLPEGLNAVELTGVVNLTTSNGTQACGTFSLNTVAPSLFTADNSGGWLAAAQVVITHADGSQTIMDSIAQYSDALVYNGTTWSHWVPIPINLGSGADIAVLELFGTGIRGVSSYANYGSNYSVPNVTICTNASECDGVQGNLTVLYGGPQGEAAPGSFYGLDQINVVLPQSLAGSGMNFVVVGVASYCAGCGVVVNGILEQPWQELTTNIVQIYIE